MKLGILALGRPTFDVPFAEQKLEAMLEALETTGHELIGAKILLLDDGAIRSEIGALKAAEVDQVLLLQVTFTDASMAVVAAAAFSQPLLIWAVPEPRLGGRLRLNAFCGLNLASHALGLNKQEFGWLYADPNKSVAADLADLLAGERQSGRLDPSDPPPANVEGQSVAAAVNGSRIARIGEHPPGFDTCAYDADAIRQLAGIEVDVLKLDELFDTARAVSGIRVEELQSAAQQQLSGLDQVNAQELDRSLRLRAALEDLRTSGGYDAFAIRCWPEAFTEFGGAVCGPASMSGEARTPCACEADVYGALTQLILQESAQSPVFLTDLVDFDTTDDTAVVWHCGQAPISMCSPEDRATATVHTNRKKPLLYQFPLKPGNVTLLRISQSFGQPKMVLGFGEMLRRPMAFTGTSGVLRFERPASEVLTDLIASGLEHHMALAFGDHRETLRGVAGALKLPILEI